MKLRRIIITSFISLLIPLQASALEYENAGDFLSDLYNNVFDKNEGVYSFKSLLIPFGGRSESLGSAYTGLGDDISYLKYNPAAGSIQSETQLSLFHNSWIADSQQETIAYTTRAKNKPNLSYGGYLSSFFVPFTEYNIFGERVAANYFSETTAAINVSYNFLSGYNFRGIAVGGNLKTAWRGIPDYTDKTTDAIIPQSGLSQCGLAIMGDFGIMTQFNLLKYYSSREANVRIGVSLQNLGVAFTGFGDEIVLDSPLPTLLALGISVKFIKPVTLSMDYTQPLNLEGGDWPTPFMSLGASVQFTQFVSLLTGFQFKGGNPRFSLGLEFEVTKIRFNMNYTLDFTSSVSPINRFSISTKILFGDKGRSLVDEKIDELYRQGLQLYAQGEWQSAIDIWNEILKINKRFDPAIKGIQSAQNQLIMFEKIRDSLIFD